MVRLADKEKKLAQYEDALERAKVAVIADFRGLTVAQLSQLRSKLFEQGAKFTIVKNTLFKRAIKDKKHASLEEFFQGPRAVLFGFEDEITPIKTLKQFLKEAKIGEIQGGWLAGDKLSSADVLRVADLPSLEQLRGQLAGAIYSPLTGVVRCIGSSNQSLVNILDQYAKLKAEQQ